MVGVADGEADGFQVGDAIEAKWGNHSWFPCTIASIGHDGIFFVDWKDGNTHGRKKTVKDLRRPGVRGSCGSPAAAQSEAAEARQFCPPPSSISGSFSTVGANIPGSNVTIPALNASLDHTPSTTEATQPRNCRSPTVASASPLSIPSAPSLGSSVASAPEICASSPGGQTPHGSFARGQRREAQEESCTTPATAPASDGGVAASVRCFLEELANGEKRVVVQTESGKRWSFNQRAIAFELRADSKRLSEWIESLEDQQMPGLLTLLAGEVNERGEELRAVEGDRDALRGSEDYEFFGLDAGGCTDRDVERAYRKMSMQLHPDKGGDEAAFNDMRKKYEELRALRTEGGKRKSGGSGSIRWDPKSRQSMLQAHSDLREQLIWITRHLQETKEEVEALRQHQRVQRSLTWATPHCQPEASIASCASPLSQATAVVR